MVDRLRIREFRSFEPLTGKVRENFERSIRGLVGLPDGDLEFMKGNFTCFVEFMCTLLGGESDGVSKFIARPLVDPENHRAIFISTQAGYSISIKPDWEALDDYEKRNNAWWNLEDPYITEEVTKDFSRGLILKRTLYIPPKAQLLNYQSYVVGEDKDWSNSYLMEHEKDNDTLSKEQAITFFRRIFELYQKTHPQA